MRSSQIQLQCGTEGCQVTTMLLLGNAVLSASGSALGIGQTSWAMEAGSSESVGTKSS